MTIALAAFGASGATSLAVSASGVSSSGSGFIGCGHPAATGNPGLFVSGGSGNYSYVWSRQGAAATYGPWVCSNTAAQNPTWSSGGPVCADAIADSEVWQVIATDDSTGQHGSTTITVTFTWSDLR